MRFAGIEKDMRIEIGAGPAPVGIEEAIAAIAPYRRVLPATGLAKVGSSLSKVVAPVEPWFQPGVSQ